MFCVISVRASVSAHVQIFFARDLDRCILREFWAAIHFVFLFTCLFACVRGGVRARVCVSTV